MKERLLNQLSLTRRLRQFLVLFTLLLMPLGAWADYELAIQYGTEESNFQSVSVPESTTDVLGDGTITYDSNTHVLTLNGANVTCSYNNSTFIVNNGYWDAEQELTVRLVGSNTITLGNGSSFYDGKGITFVTGEGNDGSLTIVKESGWNGILFKDNSTEITPTCKDGLTYNSSTSEITLAEDHYSLWICGTQVTDANKDDILGDGKWSYVHYSGSWLVMELTLHGVSFENYSGNVISTGSRLTVKIDQGSTNTISCADGYYPFYSDNESLIYFDAYLDGTITGTNRKPFSDNCNYFFETHNGYQGPTLYFTQNGYTIAPGTNQMDVAINDNYLYDENHADVFGDGSVSAAENGTTVNITLNNADFRGPITTEEYENVVVDLTGVNYIRVIDEPDKRAFHRSYDGSYSVTFTGDGELRVIDKYITSADDPFTSHEYSSSNTYDASANFTTGGWSKEYVTPTDGSTPYLRIYKAPGYDLWIGDVRVTDYNSTYTNIQGGNIKVGYARFYHGSDGSNTLELHNIQTKDCIKSGLGDLKIKLFGHNRIGFEGNDEVTPAIYSTNGGTLTLTKGSTHASLYVETSQYATSVIFGFENFVYTGFSIDSYYDISYNTELGLNNGEYGLETATFYTGELYNLWVGKTQVSSANLDDIRDDNISTGTVSFDPATNTLTMNNVTADMATDDDSFISSRVENLTIKLLGTNEVTLDYNEYGDGCSGIRWLVETGPEVPTLTFDTQRAKDLNDHYVYGSLTVKLSNGKSNVYDGTNERNLDLVVRDYTITNTIGGDFPSWRISDDLTDQAKIWYDGETYGLTVAKISVTSANASNVLGDAITGTVSYDAATNTLTLDNVDLSEYGSNIYDRLIRYSGTDDLTIALKGDNNLSKIEYSSAGSGTPTLSFVKADNADDCTLELNYASSSSNESVIFLFKDVDFGNLFTISEGPLTMEPFSNVPNQNSLKYSLREYNTSVEHLVITSATTYPLWVGETQVTEANKANVKEDNTSSVSFAYNSDNEKNTLILTNALLNKAIVSGLGNLTIHLSGTSTIESQSNIPKAIQSINSDAILTFTSDVDQASLPNGYLMFGDHVTTPLDGFASYAYNNGLAYGRSDETRCVGLISYFLIGSDEINSAKLSVIGDMVSYNNQTNTLSLNGIGNAGDIRYNQYEDITIEFNGSSLTGYIAGTGNGNLYIKKAANAESPELDINGNYDGMGPISGFKNCTWEDGLYMNPYEGTTVLSGVYFNTVNGHFSHPSSSVDQIIFSTEQAAATPSIWFGTIEVDQNGRFIDNQGQEIAGVSFTSGDENVLTLSGPDRIASIISSLPNLTIKLSGNNNEMYKIVSSNPSAVLTIVKDAEAESASLKLNTEMESVISGFAGVLLTDLYYECSEMYEYNTTSKKFVNPIANTDIGSLTISSTEAYPLWIAGTQVTGDNASNIFDDAYASASYAGNTLTLKACQNSSTDYDYAIMIGGEENLNIDFVGFNHLGSTHTKTFIYAKDACTVTFTTDETMPGQMECYIKDGGDFKTDNVTIEAGDLEMEEVGSTTTFQSSSANNIYYFGIQSFNANYWEGDYPSGDYVWYFSNAATNSDNSDLPPIVSSSEGTSKMKHETGYDLIKTLTFQCLPLSGDAAITVALKNLENESVEYATGTLTNGVVTLTPNAKVTYEDVCLVFTSTSSFSFVPLAVQTEIKPDVPYFFTHEENTPVGMGFEFDGDEVRYSIDYASDELQDVEDAIWESGDEDIAIAGPCTVTAYVVKDGVSSDIVKGKYFGPASTKQTIALGADPVELAIAPAIEEGDGIMIYGIESNYINFNETTQKATATTMGSGSFPVSLKYTGQEYEEGNTVILNSSNFEMQVEVVAALDIEFAGANSWASYYATENLNVPEGLTAYVVSAVDEENGSVTVAPVDYIPANKAVLLKRANDGAASGYTAGAYTGSTSTFTNLLGGSTSATAISSLGSGPVYVLFNDKFKRAISGTIPARRAYLALGAAVAPTSAPQYLTISITDGNTTAIDTLTVDDDSNDSWYTIDGLKLNGKPQRKGLYINNGKKVYINNK